MIGHALWLIAISLATDAVDVSTWVLVVSAVCLVAAVAAGLAGRHFHRRKAYAKAWFLWCLPVTPVLFSIVVLGVTYL